MNKSAKLLRIVEVLSDSLESHIPSALGDMEENECCRKAVGSPKFHLTCIKDYGEAIGLATSLL